MCVFLMITESRLPRVDNSSWPAETYLQFFSVLVLQCTETRTLSALHINEWKCCVLIHQINWNCLTMDRGMFHPESTAFAYSLFLWFLFYAERVWYREQFVKNKYIYISFLILLFFTFIYLFILFKSSYSYYGTLIWNIGFHLITVYHRLLRYCRYWQFNASWYCRALVFTEDT